MLHLKVKHEVERILVFKGQKLDLSGEMNFVKEIEEEVNGKKRTMKIFNSDAKEDIVVMLMLNSFGAAYREGHQTFSLPFELKPKDDDKEHTGNIIVINWHKPSVSPEGEPLDNSELPKPELCLVDIPEDAAKILDINPIIIMSRFDLPDTIEGDESRKYGFDPNADGHFLKQIIHKWPKSEEALAILEHARIRISLYERMEIRRFSPAPKNKVDGDDDITEELEKLKKLVEERKILEADDNLELVNKEKELADIYNSSHDLIEVPIDPELKKGRENDPIFRKPIMTPVVHPSQVPKKEPPAVEIVDDESFIDKFAAKKPPLNITIMDADTKAIAAAKVEAAKAEKEKAEKEKAEKEKAEKEEAEKTEAEKTEAEEPAPVKKAPAKKTTTKKAPAKKTTTKKAPAKKALVESEEPAKKAPVKKTTTKKAPAKKTVVESESSDESEEPVKKVPVKKTATKKAPAKKVAVKKTVVESESSDESEEPVKKAPVKKAATKKAPAKKVAIKKTVVESESSDESEEPVKKAPVKKTVTKKAPAKKITVKKAVKKSTEPKTPVAKTTTKKAPVKKTTTKVKK